MANIGGQKCV